MAQVKVDFGAKILVFGAGAILVYLMFGNPDIAPSPSPKQHVTRDVIPDQSEHEKPTSRRRVPEIVREVFGCTHYPCVIRDSQGGDPHTFRSAAWAVRRTNGLMIVHGECASACVITADVARNHFCMTGKARLGFHMGHRTSYGWDGRILRVLRRKASLSGDIDEIVMRHGGYPYDGMNMIRYTSEMEHIWRACTKNDWSRRE